MFGMKSAVLREQLRDRTVEADSYFAQLVKARLRIEDLEAELERKGKGWPEDWRLLQIEGDDYPPEAFLYRGGIYRYVLEGL